MDSPFFEENILSRRSWSENVWVGATSASSDSGAPGAAGACATASVATAVASATGAPAPAASGATDCFLLLMLLLLLLLLSGSDFALVAPDADPSAPGGACLACPSLASLLDVAALLFASLLFAVRANCTFVCANCFFVS